MVTRVGSTGAGHFPCCRKFLLLDGRVMKRRQGLIRRVLFLHGDIWLCSVCRLETRCPADDQLSWDVGRRMGSPGFLVSPMQA